eukprot:TRINITY_DN1585_c0_g1_i1.p1 TRINITY_DN1585_c0_g1~~TRINITY_DN1585_c0_g1_i1.p1  ORF type:complete len:217 (+),score=31.29 TRINITY_DN1585_c0_g1_i1:643-1293(+)
MHKSNQYTGDGESIIKISAEKSWVNLQDYDVFPKGWTHETMKELLEMRSAISFYLDKKLPRVLVHGDYRLGNIMVYDEKEKPECTIVDWQIIHVGHPFQDLAFFMTSDLPTETRRKVEKDMLKYYLRKLKKEGVHEKYLDFDEAWLHYRLSSLEYAVLMWYSGSGFIDLADSTSSRQISTYLRRTNNAIVDHDSIKLAKSVLAEENHQKNVKAKKH